MNDFDLVIAGGGPVGLATAIAARQRGLGALVLEQSRHSPEKACGEGLMPSAVAAAGALGVSLVEASPFRGIRFIDGGDVAAASFEGELGRALPRARLMAALERRADELGVQRASGHTLTAFEYRGRLVHIEARTREGRRLSVRASLLVAADGLRSSIRRKLGYELPPAGPPRFGLTCHYEVAPWSDWVEVYWHDRAELYVTPVASGQVGIAVLSHGAPLSHADALPLFPDLAAKLMGNTEHDRVRGAGPLEQRSRGVLAPGVALVGDAAGYVDALSGEGLALGFRSALTLVERYARGQLWAYSDDHAELTAAYLGVTRFMLALSRRPRARRRTIAWASRHPRVLSRLLAVVASAAALPTERPGDIRRQALAALGRALA